MINNSPAFSDPYPVYGKMLKQRPIFQDANGTWHFTRYDDVKMMFTDPRFTRHPPGRFGYVNQEKAETELDKVIGKWSLFNDPPEHTRLREMLSVMVNPRFIKDTRSIIESVAEDLLASLLQKNSADFMLEFAYPLPVRVINKLLGTTLDNLTLRKWSLSIVNALDRGSPDDFASINSVMVEIQQYFRELIHAREQHPENDWISDLVRIKNEYQLNADDMIANCIFLLLAGHETVQLSLGLGLNALLKSPEQRNLLVANPDLAASAVEEILRFESPLNKISRWTSETVVVNNIIIPENQLVVGLLNAANRDPERFDNPDKLDITRKNNRHLAFGLGIHNCLGALLARLELQIALQKLIPYLNQFRLMGDQTEWVGNSSLRYLFKLMVHVRPESA
ncbi:Cytochrome P450 107B1 [Aquicella siphonis]|uniref:Cytochrome P450 107B1 n=1 Tax=Aquicella siphonis TaxID=254247 RepID=A0A5E4PDX3_9COXI|nr:cytochrome P450 [Aquicella siphonis]VVC74772.1 Cytochrome P450 107B1 [Aquicella siphonis]